MPSPEPPRILIIGAGSRGRAYAEAVRCATHGVVAAVAEPDDFKRRNLGAKYIWGAGTPTEGSEFASWEDFIAYERHRRRTAAAGGVDTAVPPGIDAVFVCVLDEMHHDVVMALAGLGGLHIMCEKPLATRPERLCGHVPRSARRRHRLLHRTCAPVQPAQRDAAPAAA